MTLVVRLTDGVTFHVEESQEDFTTSLREALSEYRLIEIKTEMGKIRFFNPYQVIYFEYK